MHDVCLVGLNTNHMWGQCCLFCRYLLHGNSNTYFKTVNINVSCFRWYQRINKVSRLQSFGQCEYLHTLNVDDRFNKCWYFSLVKSGDTPTDIILPTAATVVWESVCQNNLCEGRKLLNVWHVNRGKYVCMRLKVSVCVSIVFLVWWVRLCSAGMLPVRHAGTFTEPCCFFCGQPRIRLTYADAASCNQRCIAGALHHKHQSVLPRVLKETRS